MEDKLYGHVKYNYLDNTPKSRKEYLPYAERLNELINKDNEVYNIGIVASYGAGKSSVIKTFIDEFRIPKKEYLTVSLANFNDDEKKPDGNVQLANIEKSILQQVFYKEQASKLPKTKLDRIKPLSLEKIFFNVSLLLAAILTALFCSVFYSFPFSWGAGKFVCSIIFLSGALICSAVVIFLLLLKVKIKTVDLKDLKVDFDESGRTNTSLINDFLDEIIYFFQKTKYRIVFFEDIDRFDAIKIFTKLRELNNALNSNNKIRKSKTITFVYAIKDTLFKNEEERSKFFDFIIPVVPVINYTTANNTFLSTFEKCNELTVSKIAIKDLSYFVKDMRILNNCLNDFKFYYNLLNVEKMNIKNKDTLLFAMMLYKNICPKEFATLQTGVGKIKNLFSNKETIIHNKKIEIDKKISGIEQQIIDSNAELAEDFNELKAIVGAYIDKAQKNNYNGTDLNLKNSFLNISDATVIYNRNSSYGLSFKEINQATNIVYREKLVKIKNEAYKIKLQEELARLRVEKRVLSQLTIAQYIAKYRKDEFSELKDDKMLSILISKGYINEHYQDFIMKIGDGFISASDKQFIVGVINEEKQDDFTLNNAENVIIELDEFKFDSPSILNYDLAERILDLGTTNEFKINVADKRKRFVTLLKSDDERTQSFIKEYLLSEKHLDAFIYECVSQVNNFWTIVESLNNKERELTILTKIFESCTEEQIIALKCDEITNYINHVETLDDCFKGQETKVKTVFKELNIKVENLGSSHNGLLSVLINNNLYKLSLHNTKYICDNFLKLDGYTEHIIDSLFSCGNENVISYYKSNVNSFCENVILADGITVNDSESSIKMLLSDEKVYDDLKERLIKKQTKTIMLDVSIANLTDILLTQDKAKPSHDTVNFALGDKDPDLEIICAFMFRHFEEINLSKVLTENDSFRYDLINYNGKDCSDDKLRKLLDILKDELTLELITNAKAVETFVERKQIKLEKGSFEYVCKFSWSIIEKYLKGYENEISSAPFVLVMDSETLKKVVLSNVLVDGVKWTLLKTNISVVKKVLETNSLNSIINMIKNCDDLNEQEEMFKAVYRDNTSIEIQKRCILELNNFCTDTNLVEKSELFGISNLATLALNQQIQIEKKNCDNAYLDLLKKRGIISLTKTDKKGEYTLIRLK